MTHLIIFWLTRTLFMILQVCYSFFNPSSTSKPPSAPHFPPPTMTLQEVIEADNVDELYSLIKGNENLLDHGHEGPFPNTPLHNAANKGRIKVAMEIAILKPLFTQKLNQGDLSPMHLALHQKHYHIARALMSLDPELIRVHRRGKITPLHFVAGERGKSEKETMDLLELLVEFLYACKSSIEELTSQCETAVHIAVKTGNIEAFKVLLGWLKRARLTQILNWKDQDGNAILHIAAFKQQSEIIDLLLGYMDVNENNFEGRTALEIFEQNPRGSPDIAKKFRSAGRPKRLITPNPSLSEFFSRELSFSEKCANLYRVPDEPARNAILVVSTLIAAATYQAALSPPGGYWQDSSSNPPANSTAVAANSSSIALEKPHQAGEIILSGSKLYLYEICNSLAFFISILTIWVTTFTVEANPLFFAALTFLCSAFGMSSLIQIPKNNEATGYSLFALCVFFMIAGFCHSMGMRMKHIVARPRIDARGRRVTTF